MNTRPGDHLRDRKFDFRHTAGLLSASSLLFTRIFSRTSTSHQWILDSDAVGNLDT
jgi:hypothetical protein